MEFVFMKGDSVAFSRSDAQEAEWTQEEMSLSCVFPYLADKVIERGMVILFQDPATDDWEAYEVRKCSMFPGESYQQLTAEDICVSELTDCHIESKTEFDSVPASSVLSSVLSGTGWSVGSINSDPVSSGDIQRGSVWQNVSTIVQNWNVYIMPRVTVNADGITGRFLDMLPSSGVDRGLRFSINKNVTDPCVTYDDSELYTALYGYGGTYSEGSGGDRVTLEYNLAGAVWSQTADHPAKPAGQKFIEYPEKTALYGRNGKPRFGYYQNTSISDPQVLLEKTWESLKQCCDPKISITGTVSDLKRLGYADVPLRLHDMAIIELEPVGLLFYKQVIRLTVNLLDPTKNLPEIGDYIPNIIYINRATEDHATGGGGGRGGKGSTKQELENSEFRTSIYDTGREVGMNAQRIDEQGNILNQAGMHIDPDTGVLIYAEDNVNNIGSKFRVQSNRITAEVTERKAQGDVLSSRITQTSNAISLEVSERKQADNVLSASITVTAREIRSEVSASEAGLSSRITQNANSITAEVTRATAEEGNLSSRITVNAEGIETKVSKNGVISSINQTAESITIQASKVNLDGYVTSSMLESAFTSAQQISTQQMTISQYLTCLGYNVEWKTYTARHCSLSSEYYFNDYLGTQHKGRLVTGYTDTTIYYLGR